MPRLVEGLESRRIRIYISPTVYKRVEALIARYAAEKLAIPLYVSNSYSNIVDGFRCGEKGEGVEAVFAGCRPPRGSVPVLVVGVPGNRLRGFGLVRATLTRVATSLYLVLAADRDGSVYRGYFTLIGTSVEEAKPPCPSTVLAEIAELYGARIVPQRELVSFLAQRYGLKRGDARNMLEALVARGCLFPEKGGIRILLD